MGAKLDAYDTPPHQPGLLGRRAPGLAQPTHCYGRAAPLTQEELAELNESNTGFDAQVGILYTHLSRGEVRGVIHAGPQHHQPWGLVNGGVYASFAESLGSIAGVIVAGGPVVGVNNSTDFIRSVEQGPIEGVARPLQTGRRTQLWEAEMSHGGELVAKSTLRTIVVGA